MYSLCTALLMLVLKGTWHFSLVSPALEKPAFRLTLAAAWLGTTSTAGAITGSSTLKVDVTRNVLISRATLSRRSGTRYVSVRPTRTSFSTRIHVSQIMLMTH